MNIEQENLKQIEYWMHKYDTDMEAIDLKIHIERNKYATMKDKRIHIEKKVSSPTYSYYAFSLKYIFL